MQTGVFGPAAVALFVSGIAMAQQYAPGEESTFSIIGRDPNTGELGMAVQSKTIATGARSRGGKGGVAVVAHQAASDPMYGTIGIELLEAGMTPQQALDMMPRSDDGREHRQVSILDIHGQTASFTGASNSDFKGIKCGVNYCAQGNTLTTLKVLDAMAGSFEVSAGPLAERLLDALDAGEAAGGEKRGMESAALWILKPLSSQGFGDRELDLRVDESRNPFVELRRILNAVRSQQILADANSLFTSKDLKGAMEKAMIARDKAPTGDGPLLTIARIDLEIGKKGEAIAALRQAVELNPANKRQLQANKNFEASYNDSQFKAIVASN